MCAPDDVAVDIRHNLAQRASPGSGPWIVSIDGPAGSGKTTVADRLRRDLVAEGRMVSVIHMDDLYEGWEGLDADREQGLQARLIGQVFEPLSQGRTGRWQRYDWHAGRLVRWVSLPPPEVLIVEGCGSGAQAYTAYRSLLVWVEAPPAVRLARGVERDGEQVVPRWLAWMRAEDRHFSRNDTRRRADLSFVSG